MTPHTYYDPSSGAIQCSGDYADLDRMDELCVGLSRVEGYFLPREHYIDLADPENPTPTERPAQTTQLTGLVLADLPVPCTIHVDATAFAHDEPTVELDFPLPGTYAVRVEAFPYLDWTTTISVA